MNQIKVGFIGFGLSGKVFHSPLLKAHSGFEVVSVRSSKPADVHQVWPNAQVTQDVFEILKNPQIDLVINCAPNSFHYSYSKAALEYGKHVIVEKPFVNTVAEGEELIRLAEKHQKRLTVFHNRRWDSDFLTVQKLIRSGELGNIQQFESHFDRWRPTVRSGRWKETAAAGSGLLYDLGVHLIDQALTLFGMPEKVMADLEIQKPNGEVDDYVHLILFYKKMRVILHASSFASVTPRFQIFGDRASFIKYGTDPQEDQMRQDVSLLDSNFGRERENHFGKQFNGDSEIAALVPSEKGTYSQFYDQLHRALSNDSADLPVHAKEALQTIQIIELAQKSSQQGQSMKVSWN